MLTYITATGQVTGNYTGYTVEQLESVVPVGTSVYDTDVRYKGSDYYIVAGVLTARPTLSLTWNKTSILNNGTDAAVVASGIPNPSIVEIETPIGVQYTEPVTITDGSLSFTAQQEGSYTIYIDSFPYKLYSQTITVGV